MAIDRRQIELRNDTPENWAQVNPVLGVAELGVERHTGLVKLGDGVTAWNDLKPINGDLDGGDAEVPA